MSISDTLSRILADRSGAAGVEFALLLPTLVLFLVGIVDLGTLTYQSMQVSAAAHAGAQYAINNSNASLTSIASAVTGATTLTVQASPAPQSLKGCVSGGVLTFVSGNTCAGGATAAGTYIQVNAQANFTPLITWSGLTMPSTLSAQAVVRVQ